jgi:hypothetical protein
MRPRLFTVKRMAAAAAAFEALAFGSPSRGRPWPSSRTQRAPRPPWPRRPDSRRASTTDSTPTATAPRARPSSTWSSPTCPGTPARFRASRSCSR